MFPGRRNFGNFARRVSVEINGESKNEKKNQIHPKNKNLSDNCSAVSAHRNLLRCQSNSLCHYCPPGVGVIGVAAGPADLFVTEYCADNLDTVDCQGNVSLFANIPGFGS